MTGKLRFRFESIILSLSLLVSSIFLVVVMTTYGTHLFSGVAETPSMPHDLPGHDFNASVTTSGGNVIVTNHDDYDYYKVNIGFIATKLSGGDYPERETHYCYFVHGITIPAHSKVAVSFEQFRNSYGVKPDWSQERPNVFMINADNEKLYGSYNSSLE